MSDWIDLRSDTVTRPSDAMRRAMYDAEVGDDVYGEDPNVNRLEEMAAELAATESAIFCPSGTQSNLLALLSHCQRGDEYIVGQQAHTFKYEAGGAAVLGSIQPQPLDFEPDGTLSLDKVESAIKPDDFHFAKTRLLSLENTQGGQIIPQDYVRSAAGFTRRKGLALHLDGARVCNAAIAQSLSVADITRYFDSTSICLSKGLGAPVGSVLCGTRALTRSARRWRKMLGGGMRQAGILAAAGIYALEHNIRRLANDHENAGLLANRLQAIDKVQVRYDQASTNMVFLRLAPDDVEPLVEHARSAGIRLSANNPMRLVMHLDVSRPDIERVIRTLSDYFRLR